MRSKATSPHAFIASETDFENVERVRRAHGERFKAEEGFSLTYLPFVARAAVEALRDFPNLNASVGRRRPGRPQRGQPRDRRRPRLRGSDRPGRSTGPRRSRCAASPGGSATWPTGPGPGSSTADDIAGGTFSITNDGPFGTYFTVPIINQPQVAILATDGIKRRPVVVDARPTAASRSPSTRSGVLGMSWDHRAVDGAYVSSFLRRVGEVLATRDWAAEL